MIYSMYCTIIQLRYAGVQLVFVASLSFSYITKWIRSRSIIVSMGVATIALVKKIISTKSRFVNTWVLAQALSWHNFKYSSLARIRHHVVIQSSIAALPLRWIWKFAQFHGRKHSNRTVSNPNRTVTVCKYTMHWQKCYKVI